MYSGGIGSYCAARRVVDAHGAANVTLLFADTMTEAPDLYTFLRAGAARLGAELVELRDGRDIWQVFKDHRYLGNTRADPCSYFLKRTRMRAWLEASYLAADVTCYLGIDWSEEHRLDRSRQYWAPYPVRAPLTEPPLLDRDQMLALARSDGLEIPSLYLDGFPHNNCGGGCVKAGQGQFLLLLAKRPQVYAQWERGEQEIREYLGKDVAILRDRRGGTTAPLTLRSLRERSERGAEVDEQDFGGCACATGDLAEDAAVEAALPHG